MDGWKNGWDGQRCDKQIVRKDRQIEVEYWEYHTLVH